MKTVRLAVLLAFCALRAEAGEAERMTLPAPAELSTRVAALLPRLVELRRELHMHPELSNREVLAAPGRCSQSACARSGSR